MVRPIGFARRIVIGTLVSVLLLTGTAFFMVGPSVSGNVSVIAANHPIGVLVSIVTGVLAGIGIGIIWTNLKLSRSLRELRHFADDIGNGRYLRHAATSAGTSALDQTMQAFAGMATRLRDRETTLRASEARYRLLSESVSDIVVTADANNVTRYVSSAVKDVLGYSVEEILSGNSNWMVHPDDMAITMENLGQLIAAPAKAVTRHRFKHKDGHYVWLETASHSVFDTETGMLIEIISVSRDITASKSVEAALLASEQRYRLLADNANDMIILQDFDRRGMYVSPSSVTLSGYEPTELITMTAVELVHPEDLAKFRRMQQELGADNTRSTNIHRMRRRDGQYIWVEASLRRILGTETEPERTLMVLRDINERKIAEDAAKKIGQLLVDAVDAITDWIMRFDRDGRLDLTNATVRRDDTRGIIRLGRTFEEIIRDARSFVLDDEGPIAFEKCIQTEITQHEAADGTPFESLIAPGRWAVLRRFRTKDGGVLVTVSEITAQKLAAVELENALQAADAASRAKSAFLASMSHEIRTPMNAVIGFSDLLLDGALDPEQRRQVELLRDAGRSLLVIINDILDLSKIEANKLDLEQVPLQPAEIVDGAIAIVRAQAEAKGLRLRVELDPSVPSWIKGDPTRLRQILLNLLGNAIKFTQSGEIAVTARRLPGALLHFEVQDSGIGIPEDRRHLLFRDFSQVDRSTTRHFGGTGLGLSICKRLAEAMGGSIGVESRPGEGTVFWFEIEAIETAASQPDRGSTAAVVGRCGRVLVAEDVEVNQLIIKAMLTNAGHDVVIVNNGAEAVAAIRESAFDVVLMDMEMPVMDGIQAARAIRDLDGDAGRTPIVALTANAMTEAIERCAMAGMNGHLSKPIDRAEMVQTVARWCGQASRQTENAASFV